MAYLGLGVLVHKHVNSFDVAGAAADLEILKQKSIDRKVVPHHAFFFEIVF